MLNGAAFFLGYNARTCVGALSDAALADASGALGYNAICNAGFKIRMGSTAVTLCEYNGYQEITSDARIKENVRNDVPGLAFIMKLRPVTYDLRSDKHEEFLREGLTAESREAHAKANIPLPPVVKHQTGLIAQEVEKVCEEIGFEFGGLYKPLHDKDNYALCYSMLTVPLTKAAQEQQSLILEQKQRLARLQAEVNALSQK